MANGACVHCGQLHPEGTPFCPSTGRPLAPPQAPAPQQPQQGYAPAPQGYGPPPQGYAAPPQQGYGAPQQGYAPQQQAPQYAAQPQAPYPAAPPYGGGAYPAGYGAQPGYPAQPPPQGQTPYPGNYGGQTPYPGQAGYPGQGGYAGQGAYPGQPPYAGQPQYPGQPAPAWPGAPPGQQPGAYGMVAPEPQKAPDAFLAHAFRLYRQHFVALMLTASVLFVPCAVVKSFAEALILAPTAVTTSALQAQSAAMRRSTLELQKSLAAAAQNPKDPKARAELAAEQERHAREVAAEATAIGGVAVGGLMAILLGLLATLVTAFIMYGFVIPMTTGAVTITVADRILGGKAGPGEAYKLLFRRFGKMLSAVIPAALLVAIGFVFLIIPGVVLSFFFVFVAPVVLLEGIGGIAALKRSVALVKSDWVNVLIVVIVFGVINAVAHIVAGIIVGSSDILVRGLVGDALTLVLLPFPIIGTVLLYVEVRRKTEGFDDARLRTGLAALRG